jgi:cobalt-zinc-cadmium efflux system outer membrane protein
MRRLVFSAPLLAALVGCASPDPATNFADVQAVAQERIGAGLQWIRGTNEDAEVIQRADDLLKSPLSVEGAVQIALLNNRSLQATYEDLGIAQADLVKAGLLENPVFSGAARYPSESPRKPHFEFDLVGNFMSLLFLPARQQAASLELEEQKLKVTHAVLELASQTRTAYYEAIAGRQVADLRRLVAEAAEASSEFAKRLYDAGNVSELAWTLERDSFEQARLDWSRSESAASAARERLTRHMGLWGDRVNWKVPEKLPDVPATEVSVDQAERLAMSRRMDFQASLREVQFAATTLGISRQQRWLGTDLEVGMSAERESGGDWAVGPALGIQIPLFDQGQARNLRGEAILRQREHRLTALAVDIRSEVRMLRDKLIQDRRRAEHLIKVVVPLREKAVELQQEKYNFMLSGTFELLESKRREFDAYQEYIEAVRDYWVTRSEFLHSIGGSVPESN